MAARWQMHAPGRANDHTGGVSIEGSGSVSYGPGVADESELRLLGDVSGGKRVVELGIAGNAIALASLGAKSIALDPDPDAIAELRAAAARADVSVECHHGDLGDLGFAPSGTIDVVVASHTIHAVDDLSRTLRQVHRVLNPGAVFVIATAHPFHGVANAPATTPTGESAPVRRYGDDERTIGELLTALARTNFRIEAFHELGVSDDSPVPTVLVVKTRKDGS